MKPRELQSTKKPYESPKLIVYGDIRQLTHNIGHTGKQDGAVVSRKTG